MSDFTKPIKMSMTADGKKAVLLEKHVYEIGAKGSEKYVVIPAGFKWNGVSANGILQRWAAPQATLLHDWLCKNPWYVEKAGEPERYKHSLFQKQIDREFYLALLACGASDVCAWVYYKSVRIYQIMKGRK